jgi:signal transduction histidine kinase
MTRSIGRQILVPIVAIQAVTVVAAALSTAAMATSRTQRELVARIDGVAAALKHASFPLTPAVLSKMRDLSGADLILAQPDGRVLTSTIPGVERLPTVQPPPTRRERIEKLEEIPRVNLAAASYFAVSVPGSNSHELVLILFSEDLWRWSRWEAAFPPLLIGLTSLLLMVAVTYWVASRIGGRLDILKAQVARIARGDFERIEPGPVVDEVHALSESVNAMSDQLLRMRKSIEQSERTRLLAQVAAGWAHQLRNATSGARISIQLHIKRSPPQDGDRSLDVALRQLAMTEGHIRALLSLGRVEKRQPQRCDLKVILGDVLELLDPGMRHAGVRLLRNDTPGRFEVMVDPASVHAAILNLVSNATEAAGQGGTIEVGLSMQGEDVVVRIRDTGPGPAAEIASWILEPFVTSKPEGVGLGLALANQVATEHRGQLSWSREDGSTTFRLTLPSASTPE